MCYLRCSVDLKGFIMRKAVLMVLVALGLMASVAPAPSFASGGTPGAPANK
jgi:hypothetical protein